jgi:glyoxylase-like metal-dependent hydrolase (beta-lactamase superfamily II)
MAGEGMKSVEILNKGWARRNGDRWEAIPNTILVTANELLMVVDPGNDPGLPRVLKDRDIDPMDVDIVLLTHLHLDHTLNSYLFRRAIIMDPEMINEGYITYPHYGKVPGTDMEILSTPGHTADHSSLVLESEDGLTMICGDLFWWTEEIDPPMDRITALNLPDDLSLDKELLLESRKRALDLQADLYIPGHGEPFQILKLDSKMTMFPISDHAFQSMERK